MPLCARASASSGRFLSSEARAAFRTDSASERHLPVISDQRWIIATCSALAARVHGLRRLRPEVVVAVQFYLATGSEGSELGRSPEHHLDGPVRPSLGQLKLILVKADQVDQIVKPEAVHGRRRQFRGKTVGHGLWGEPDSMPGLENVPVGDADREILGIWCAECIVASDFNVVAQRAQQFPGTQ